MLSNIKQERMLLSKPGDTLQDTLDAIGMSQHELAERTGRPDKTINEVIKGKTAITRETALQFEKVLGVPASFWLNLEANYQEALTQLKEKERLTQQLEWLRQFPIVKMKKLGWLQDISDKVALAGYMLRYFRVASPTEWNLIYLTPEPSTNYRMPLAGVNEPGAIAAWLRQGEIQADKLNLPDFNKQQFSESLKAIKVLVRDHPADYKERLQAICLRAGVALIYTPNLPKATPCGVARWYNNNPLIQLSCRYRTNDSLWFTFYHEAGHILLHGKKDVFIEDVAGIKIDEKKEQEADKFASDWLLTEEQYQRIIQMPLTVKTVKDMAKEYQTHPGIIVGRLEHKKQVAHGKLSFLKRKITVE